MNILTEVKSNTTQAEKTVELSIFEPGKVIPFPQSEPQKKVVGLHSKLGNLLPVTNEVIMSIRKMVTWRAQEIARIGFGTESKYLASNEDDNLLDPEHQVAKEKDFNKLIQGHSRIGHVEKNDGSRLERLTDLLDMISSFKQMYPVKNLGNKRSLYMFVTPSEYKAFTGEVRLEDLYYMGLTRVLRADITEEDTRNPNKSGELRLIFYTPRGAIPTQQTNIISFVHSQNSGLELWQPGQYIGLLPSYEKDSWVHINLFDN